MKIRMTLDVEIDVAEWRMAYGHSGHNDHQIGEDVRSHIVNLINECPAAKEGHITGVTTPRAVTIPRRFK